jgi:hypothetical protein
MGSLLNHSAAPRFSTVARESLNSRKHFSFRPRDPLTSVVERTYHEARVLMSTLFDHAFGVSGHLP